MYNAEAGCIREYGMPSIEQHPFIPQSLYTCLYICLYMKLQQMKTGQYFVFLPTQITRAKGWKKGDDIKVTIDSKGDLVLKK